MYALSPDREICMIPKKSCNLLRVNYVNINENVELLQTFLYRLNVDWIVARNFHSKPSVVLVYDQSGDGCWFDGSTTDGACTSPDAASQRCRSIHPSFELHPALPLLLPTCHNSPSCNINFFKALRAFDKIRLFPNKILNNLITCNVFLCKIHDYIKNENFIKFFQKSFFDTIQFHFLSCNILL